ncbi:MAG: TRAP transporter small permease subunit [Thermoplasmata archaeon]
MFLKVFELYKRLIDIIEKLEIIITSFLLGLMACIIMLEIVSRYFLKHPFPWVFELTMIMITYVVYIGIPIMYKQKALIILEFLSSRLPLNFQEIIYFIWELMIGVLMIFIIIATHELMIIQRKYTSPTLDISFIYFTLPILISGISILLINIKNIIEHLKNFNRKNL